MKIIIDNKNGNIYKTPIVSYGIIPFTVIDRSIHFLMIRRKDSVGYIDLIRGKYLLYYKNYLQNIIDVMTLEEKNNLLTGEFKDLWEGMWGKNSSMQYRNEETTSQKKLESLKLGIQTNYTFFNLESLIKESKTNYEENEWGFPKGRKNYQEKDLNCAIREFEEETGISKTKLDIISNLFPMEEIFMGSNEKSYKHKYYLAYIKDGKDLDLNNFQKTEVSKVEWKKYDEAVKCLRDYQDEKQKIIIESYNIISNFKLIS